MVICVTCDVVEQSEAHMVIYFKDQVVYSIFPLFLAMQFLRNRTLKINPRLTGERKSEHYPFSLQFYQVPPTENISLSEFETFAVERLKLLKSIENLGVSYVKVSTDYTTKLENELRKLKFPYRSPQNDINDEAYDQRRKDHISHFILRLAYCQSEDLRRWFIQQEMDLFKFRFNQLPKDKVQEFLKYSGLEYLAISEEEKKQHHEDLINSTYGLSSTKLEDLEFYKFDKGYAYSIRHNYGKEGKRTDYTPYSCMKIIVSNPPSQGDYHGCPFRHSDPELLKQKLQSFKVASTGINQILDLVKGMHYQLACQKYFELTHNVDDCGFSLNHPNQYFIESQKLLTGGQEIKKEQASVDSSQANSQSQIASSSSSALMSTQSDEVEDLEQFFNEC
ncbi:DNA primase large subunit-like isoform X1 [Lithobates pipiens]